MKQKSNRSFRVALACVAVVSGAVIPTPRASAATVQLGYIVPAQNIAIKYVAQSSTVGKLTVTGVTIGWLTSATSSTLNHFANNTLGSFTINAFFDLASGALLGNRSDNLLSVTGQLTAGSPVPLYQSFKLYAVNDAIAPTGQSTFDFLWRNDGGAFSNSSTAPFIGTNVNSGGTLMNSTRTAAAYSTTSTMSYTNALAPGSRTYVANDIIFQSSYASATANAFMVPTPASFAGGLALFAGSALGRRRSVRLV